MKRVATFWSVILALLASVAVARAQGGEIIVLEIEGPVTPTMSAYFERGIKLAESEGAQAVLVVLDTPGGEVNTTLDIVQLLRSSSVPIIVYISPRGAQAASAGSVVTMAAHAAAMAPETVIGAAAPVGEGGAELDETISRKIKEDLKATMRNLTARRGEEATTLAEAMVEEARAVTATEALDAGLIDVVAVDVSDLLAQLDGETVVVNDQTITLATAGAAQRPLPLNPVERVLHALANPLLIGILLTIGVQAIIIEISHPGGWVAGLIGVLFLGLAFYGIGQLPVNWLGLGLVLVAFVLFIMEALTSTSGALTVAGMLTLVGGLILTFNSPGSPEFARISIPAAIGISAFTAAFFVFVLAKALRAQRRQPTTGSQALLGRSGPVRTPMLAGEENDMYVGTVMVRGELWRARAEAPLEVGDVAVIRRVDGFTVTVEKAAE